MSFRAVWTYSVMQAWNPCEYIKYFLVNCFLSFRSCEAKRKKTVEKERNGTLSRHENISTQPLKLITRNLWFCFSYQIPQTNSLSGFRLCFRVYYVVFNNNLTVQNYLFGTVVEFISESLQTIIVIQSQGSRGRNILNSTELI